MALWLSLGVTDEGLQFLFAFLECGRGCYVIAAGPLLTALFPILLGALYCVR